MPRRTNQTLHVDIGQLVNWTTGSYQHRGMVVVITPDRAFAIVEKYESEGSVRVRVRISVRYLQDGWPEQ